MQRHLGDVELVLADQLQQKVERPGEVDQPHGELAGVLDLRRSGGNGVNRRGDRLFRHLLTVDHRYDNLFRAHSGTSDRLENSAHPYNAPRSRR
ncbi:hypothetical protein Adu01nite_93560 [Paractinoplanes durhamensis]|uniref:Uncharacterized protein n=1 Tax=Paractinoplanes durhamensis TaxID=113563 RepID=A0ABQ3ZDU9_9ACTN|nr:hypothetical protein Adu01nite_93560 [Actinoplanes durhamensis]